MKHKIPILPIPNLVFFPNTAIPILVVEPVYIKMIRECVSKGMYLGISMAEPVGNFGGSLKYTPRKVCSMGKPIILEELTDDGGIKVLIRGLQRVHLLEIYQNLPYLIYEAEELPDTDSEPSDCDSKLSHLKDLLDEWIFETITDSLERETFYQNLNGIEDIIDYTCMFLVQDREMRQLLLENTSLNERIHILSSLLHGDNPWYEDTQIVNAIKSFETIEKTSKIAH